LRRLDLRKAQAARLNTIRDINRQIVLNYVREREPISRAEIARETELQRSTISAIVEDLKTEGLVEEVGEGESTGGRRPTLLKLRAAGTDRTRRFNHSDLHHDRHQRSRRPRDRSGRVSHRRRQDTQPGDRRRARIHRATKDRSKASA
jgi:DNA-binding MarR family transcriptional regulator